jgi:hypothetical protein
MRPKKLIFYAPGLISLAILLPLMMHQFNDRGYFKKYYVLESTWLNPKDTALQKWYKLPERKWLQVNLIGNKAMDHSQLKGLRTVVHTMMTTYDTINGVHIRLTDTAKYESLVEIFDIAQLYDRIAYCCHKNDFWFFINDRYRGPEPDYHFSCGTPFVVSHLPSHASMFDFPLQYTFSKGLWLMWVILGLLGLSAVRTIRSARL